MTAFGEIAASLDYPMYIVTTAVDGARSGCLVGFASQCSIDPPRFCVWISKVNHTFTLSEHAEVLAVHVLRKSNRGLAELFGETTGDHVDKFSQCEWTPGPGDAPILAGCDWFAGRVTQRADTGDHVAYVLDPFDTGTAQHHHEPQLGFQDVRDFNAGHHP